jgi:hypothetical protein
MNEAMPYFWSPSLCPFLSSYVCIVHINVTYSPTSVQYSRARFRRVPVVVAYVGVASFLRCAYSIPSHEILPRNAMEIQKE